MKTINISAALRAHASVLSSSNNVEIYRRIGNGQKLEKAKAVLADYRAELEEASRKLSDAIAEAEGRATVRTITAREVIEAVSEIDRKLNITKKAKEGVMAWIDPNAQKFPNAYKWTPVSTHVKLEFRGGWKVTRIERSRCDKTRCILTLTPDAEQAILDNYRRF